MLRALEAHQSAFLDEALPMASTSAGTGRRVAVVEPKSIWEMGMDDFEDEEESGEESEEEEQGALSCGV